MLGIAGKGGCEKQQEGLEDHFDGWDFGKSLCETNKMSGRWLLVLPPASGYYSAIVQLSCGVLQRQGKSHDFQVMAKFLCQVYIYR